MFQKLKSLRVPNRWVSQKLNSKLVVSQKLNPWVSKNSNPWASQKPRSPSVSRTQILGCIQNSNTRVSQIAGCCKHSDHWVSQKFNPWVSRSSNPWVSQKPRSNFKILSWLTIFTYKYNEERLILVYYVKMSDVTKERIHFRLFYWQNFMLAVKKKTVEWKTNVTLQS